MNEEAILEAIGELNSSMVAMTTKSNDSKRMFLGVIGTLLGAFLIGVFIWWKSADTKLNHLGSEVEIIKERSNHNNRIISKTITVDLIYFKEE